MRIIVAGAALLAASQRLGVLGTGFTTETDGERKHLHFGIHKGPAINIKGYVSSSSELKNWLDPAPYFTDLPSAK